jgi:hypothetical protein
MRHAITRADMHTQQQMHQGAHHHTGKELLLEVEDDDDSTLAGKAARNALTQPISTTSDDGNLVSESAREYDVVRWSEGWFLD